MLNLLTVLQDQWGPWQDQFLLHDDAFQEGHRRDVEFTLLCFHIQRVFKEVLEDGLEVMDVLLMELGENQNEDAVEIDESILGMSWSTLLMRAGVRVKTAGALVQLNGITKYFKCRYWLLKPIFHSFPTLIWMRWAWRRSKLEKNSCAFEQLTTEDGG